MNSFFGGLEDNLLLYNIPLSTKVKYLSEFNLSQCFFLSFSP